MYSLQRAFLLFYHLFKTKKHRLLDVSYIWCGRQESNLHALRHTHLKRARLPIPPPGHYWNCGVQK